MVGNTRYFRITARGPDQHYILPSTFGTKVSKPRKGMAGLAYRDMSLLIQEFEEKRWTENGEQSMS